MGNKPIELAGGAQLTRFKQKQAYSAFGDLYSSLEWAYSSLEIPREEPVIKYPDQVYSYKKTERNIGILNPIVLAQLMSQIRIENPELMKDQQVISLLNQYIDNIPEDRRPEKIKYVKDLYEDKSVLFQPVVTGAILNSKTRAKMKNLQSAATMAMKTGSLVLSGEEGTGASIQRTGAGGAPGGPADNAIKIVEEAKQAGGAKKGELCLTKVGVSNRKAILGDVIQGASVDCYLLAALFSWAWKLKGPILPTIENGVNKIRFWDYDSASNSWNKTDYPLDKTLPLNSSLQQVFAQQTGDTYEIWPALYEKAYAQYKRRPGLDPQYVVNAKPGPNTQPGQPPSAYDPDIGRLDLWDPVLALSELTGLPARFDSGDLGYPTVYMTDDIKAQDTIFTILEGKNIVNTFPKNPTVAWTKDAAAFPADLGFDMVLAPSHSYSVLGTHTTASGKWLVLRNPWGWPIEQKSAHADFRNEIAPAIPGSPEKPNQWKYDESQPYYLPINSNAYGIFGITDTGFRKYFKGFGWVQAC